MSSIKCLSITLVISILLTSGVCQAATSTGKISGGSSSSAVSVEKKSNFVKLIANNVLYLVDGSQYRLKGVNVLDYSQKNVKGQERKKIAEMMFVNGALKEVVFR
jgi:hypothetical protein